MPTSFDSIFFAGPYLVCYCLRSPVLTAPVRGSTPTSAVQRQLLSSGSPVNSFMLSRRQLPLSSFVQPTLIRVPLPLPDTARFQVQESFVWFRAKTKESFAFAGNPSIDKMKEIGFKITKEKAEGTLQK